VTLDRKDLQEPRDLKALLDLKELLVRKVPKDLRD
jgi:hypothetical protein